MKETQRVDLGTVQIHNKVIADIAKTAITDISGVTLSEDGLAEGLFKLLGKTDNSGGIVVRVDKNNEVSIEVKARIRYGLNIPETARHVQDAVKAAVEKTVDIVLKEVNVNIQGIERGK